MDEDKKPESPDKPKSYVAIGLIFGAGIGTALSASTGNSAMIGLGAGLGLVLGMIFSGKR